MAYPRRTKQSRPYKRKRTTKTSKPYAKISNGGVGGAAQDMVPRPMPPPMEVKTFDIDVKSSTPPAPPLSPKGFFLCDTTNTSIGVSFLGGIGNGNLSSQRIGRQIRVVGLCLRGFVYTPPPTGSLEGTPWVMDFIWDKQPNGTSPLTSQIYAEANSTILKSFTNLPNPDFVKRFSFLKRLQSSGRVGIPSAQQLVDATIKTNRVVSYDNAIASATSVEQNALYISFGTDRADSTFVGTLRVMYVDA